MTYTIRPLKVHETAVLDDFLYEAIFIPEGVEPPPRAIIEQPELQVYTENFGSRRGDICFVSEVDEKNCRCCLDADNGGLRAYRR